MFSAAYIIFSIGLIRPLQEAVFPDCFATHAACGERQTHAMGYAQIGGIIAGMLLFGALGDVVGRRAGRCAALLRCAVVAVGAFLHCGAMRGSQRAHFSGRVCVQQHTKTPTHHMQHARVRQPPRRRDHGRRRGAAVALVAGAGAAALPAVFRLCPNALRLWRRRRGGGLCFPVRMHPVVAACSCGCVLLRWCS